MENTSFAAERWILRAGGRSATGPIRSINEDDLRFLGPHNLAVVCDGMGGNCSGRPAAKTAVWAACERFERGDPPGWRAPGGEAPALARLREATRGADLRVTRLHPLIPVAGTTLVALHLGDGALVLAHAGDCRAARWRGDDELEVFTRDHSLLGMIEAAGQAPSAAERERFAGVTTRVLGLVEPRCPIDLHRVPMVLGDRFALTTDGVHRFVDDRTIAAILGECGDDLEAAAAAMIDAAIAQGSDDNATALIVEVTRARAPAPSFGNSTKPTLPWLYAPAGPLPEVPERWRERAPGAASEQFRELYALVMGDDG